MKVSFFLIRNSIKQNLEIFASSDNEIFCCSVDCWNFSGGRD
jgi:hypothetical protein